MKEIKEKNFFALLFLALFFFSTCNYGFDEALARRNPLYQRTNELKDLGAIPDVGQDTPYKILVISDAHFGAETLPQNGPRKDEEFFAWFDKLQGEDVPKFAIFLGDNAEHGWKGEFEACKNFCDRLEKKGVKSYHAVGNHDLYNQGFENYSKIIFPYTLYRFTAGGFSYYFIDTASGFLGKRQMKALKKAFDSDQNPKIVSSHFPIWTNGHFYFSLQDSSERNLLIAYMAMSNVKACLTGHTHREAVSDFSSFTEYNYPGFFARSGWGVLTVDPKNQSVKNEYIYLPCSKALCARFPSRALCRGCTPPASP